jgi:arylsulfatase A-like enzyme
VSRVAAAGKLALTGVGIALWTAAAHLTIVWIIRVLKTDTHWPWSGRDVLWMVPIGYLLLFAIPVVLFTLLHVVWPRIARPHRVFGVWAGLGLFSLMLLYTRLHSAALALLAIGGAVQLAKLYRTRGERLGKIVRQVAVGLGAFFVMIGGGGAGLRAWREQRALAAIVPPSGPAPSVLWIILDTVRPRNMSVYGAARATTPRLAEWAERGVVFDYAFATSSWTLPSHASMFTGVYASEQSGDWFTRFDEKLPTITEVLRDRGYATGGFTANLMFTGYESGLARGFVTYRDAKRTLAELAGNTTIGQADAVRNAVDIWTQRRWLGGALRQIAKFNMRPAAWSVMHHHKTAAEIAEPFLRWQSTLNGRPFFAFLNMYDAHDPQYLPADQRATFNGGATRHDIYDAAVHYQDEQIGRILDELDRRGTLRNTIVVITADHGEHLGERNLNGHGNSLYRDLVQVPLIILGVDSAAMGRRIQTHVSLRDLAATTLDLARITGQTPLRGTSLTQLWRADTAHTSIVLAEVTGGLEDKPFNPTFYGAMAAVVDDSLYLIRRGDGQLEAYAYRTDPAEAHNLAVGDALPSLRARFERLHESALGRRGPD